MTDEVTDRLDKIAAILQLAFADELSAARDRLSADPITSNVLERTSDWVSAGELVSAVVTATGKAERSVFRRLADLKDSHILLARSVGRTTEYRKSGVV